MSRRATGASRGDASQTRSGRVLVEDAAGRRPFMRGIMVHSLMARGLSFEEAYGVADAIRDEVAPRGTVRREELASLVRQRLGQSGHVDEAPPLPVTPSIAVLGPNARMPFSKGFLSQSLLAAAIDPNDAFDVAREIERELIGSGIHEIDRRDLRRRAFEALGRHIGNSAAERYLIWRRYQEPERPVILLLGGPTGAGKTSLALEVAHRLGIPRVLSTDSIRQILRITLSPELVPAIHASSYDAYRVVGPVAQGEDPVVAGFLAQASIVSVGVRAMMDRAIAENASLVLDGVSIVPGLLDLDAYASSAHVIFLVVATLDPEAFRSRFEARARGQRQRPPHRYLDNLGAIWKIQDHFLELAERHDVPIVDNESFDRSVLSIIRHVTETLRKTGKLDVAALF